MSQPEAKLSREIMKTLRLKGYFVFKVHGSEYMMAGLPDIIAVSYTHLDVYKRQGDYLAQVTKVEDAKAKSDDTFQYLFTIKLSKYSQYAYPYYCKLTENQLWKLRNLLIAAGINVPKKRVKLDPSKVVGKFIGVTMEDDEYEGKMQSNIAAIFPASELGEADNGPADDEPEDADEDAEEETEDSADEELSLIHI